MDRRRAATYLVIGLVLVVVVVLVVRPPLWLVSTGEYDRATVTAVDANGTQLATVDVRLAESAAQQRVGLSRTESLTPGEGMLFVFDGESNRSFYMKGMSFPLDMVFVAANGTITTIHHAAIPENMPESDLQYYHGRAQWVLEVPRGWTNRTGVDVGDRIEVPDGVN